MKTIIERSTGIALAIGPDETDEAGSVVVNGAAYSPEHFDIVDGSPPDDTPGKWTRVAGEWVGPPPSAEEVAAIVKHYDGVVQTRIDGVARDFGYGDPNRPEVSPILHAISYADEPSVPRFQSEGKALRAWRSLSWAAAASILNEVSAGLRAVPTEAELLAAIEAAAPAPVPTPPQA